MKAAVLGSPIGHSLSPVLHQAAYQALGLAGWSYQAIECDEAHLPARLAGCGPDWAGLSLTMPLKRVVLPLLDSLDPLGRWGDGLLGAGGCPRPGSGGSHGRGPRPRQRGRFAGRRPAAGGRGHAHPL